MPTWNVLPLSYICMPEDRNYGIIPSPTDNNLVEYLPPQGQKSGCLPPLPVDNFWNSPYQQSLYQHRIMVVVNDHECNFISIGLCWTFKIVVVISVMDTPW